MQPFQCDRQAQIPKHPITTHTQAHPTQLEATVTMRQKKGKPTLAATAAQTRYLSIRSATTLHQGHVKSHTTLQGQVSIAHHPSRSSLNRTPPFKIKSQSHTTLQGQVSIAHHLQGQVSIAHHPSRSSLNRAPPFKVKCQSHTTPQGQVSIAHHPSSVLLATATNGYS